MRRWWLLILLAVPGAVAPVQAVDLAHLPAWVRTSLSPLVIDWRQLQRDSTVPALPAPLATGALSTVHSGRYSQPAAAAAKPLAPAAPAASLPATARPRSSAASPLAPVRPEGNQLPAPVKSAGALAGLTGVGAAAPAGGSTAASGSGLKTVGPAGAGAAGASALKTASTPGVTKQLHANPAGAQALLLRIKTLLDAGKLDPAGLPQWLADEEIEDSTLVGALDQMSVYDPMDQTYIPMCKYLWDLNGHDATKCLRFPCTARMVMATYLGTLEREQEALKLLASIPDEWLKQNPSVPLYGVPDELCFHWSRSPHVCIWAWKKWAQMSGPADQAFVCWHIREACKLVTDISERRQLVRDELIPWAEDALERPGVGQRMDCALQALLWGYEALGQVATAVERGKHWTGEAERLGVALGDLRTSPPELARLSVALGRWRDAADQLRSAVRAASPDSWLAQRAQADLLRLAREHPELADVCVLPGAFREARPGRICLELRAGETRSQLVEIVGNPTLRIRRVACSLPVVVASVEGGALEEASSIHKLRLDVRKPSSVGRLAAALTVETNDAATPTVELPLSIVVRPPVAASPGELFMGFAASGTKVRCEVLLSSSTPFGVRSVRSTGPAGLESTPTRLSDRSYVLRCMLSMPQQEGVAEGKIIAAIDVPGQEEVAVPYYCSVRR